MLEIAGGILLAVIVLLIVLANLGRIIVMLYAIFLVAVLLMAVAFVLSLPDDLQNAIWVLGACALAFAGFAYWTHADKRFHISEDQLNKKE